MIGFYIINTNINNYKAHSIQVFKTIEGMRLSGLKIEMVCPRYGRNDTHRLFEEYLVKDVFPIHQVWVPGKKPSKLVFLYYSVYVCFWVFLKRLFAKCDFVYLRSEHLLPVSYVSKLFKIPLFYEIHRVGLHKNAQKTKELLSKNASALIVLTESLKCTFEKFNPTVHVEHDAVNLDNFNISMSKSAARMQLHIESEAPIVLYAGSIQKIKGVSIIIDNAHNFPDVQFLMLGWVKSDMEGLLKDLPSNVKLLGKFTQEQLPAYLKAADLLVLPHPYGPQSQSPMKLFEYMASGRPILSADLPNIREVLPPDNLFYTPEDNDSYISVLKYFLDNVEHYSNVGDLNIERVKNHTWEKRGERISQFIRQKIK